VSDGGDAIDRKRDQILLQIETRLRYRSTLVSDYFSTDAKRARAVEIA
jgi:hypothetical protein